MAKHFASLCILVLVASAASAQPAPKKAWEYSLDERIARRVDRDSIRARAPKGKEDEYAALGQSVINGRRNPELFLPWELYRDAVFTYLAAPEDWRARHRAQADDELRVWTDPAAFWTALQTASDSYAAMLAREYELLQRLNDLSAAEREPLHRQIEKEAAAQCAARADGLAAAEKMIGRETLYRFLYEIVAATTTATTSGPEQAEQLRYVARGCR